MCEKEEPTLSTVMPAHSARWVMSLFLSRPDPALMQPVTGPSARCFWDVGSRRFEPVPARPQQKREKATATLGPRRAVANESAWEAM